MLTGEQLLPILPLYKEIHPTQIINIYISNMSKYAKVVYWHNLVSLFGITFWASCEMWFDFMGSLYNIGMEIGIRAYLSKAKLCGGWSHTFFT